MPSFDSKTNLANMRVRDLRRLLSKFGMSQYDTSKILDKSELIKMAISYMEVEKRNEIARNRSHIILLCLSVVVIISLAIYFRKYLKYWYRSARSFFKSSSYQLRIKLKLIKLLIKHRLPFATLSMITTLMLDILMPAIQVSTLASWIIPSNSSLRKYFIPTLPVVIGPQMLSGNGFSSTSSSGLNIGPMITLYICSWCKHQLQEYSSKHLQLSIERHNNQRFYSTLNGYDENLEVDTTVTFQSHQNDEAMFTPGDLYLHSDEYSTDSHSKTS
eukprot:gene4827-9626_t